MAKREKRRGMQLGKFGEGEDVGGAETGADPVEDGACVVVLEGPLKAVRVQSLCPLVTQFAQQRAQPRSTHSVRQSPI